MSDKYVSPFTWANLKKRPSIIPVIGGVCLGISMATAYTIKKLELFGPDVAWNQMKKPEPWKNIEHKEFNLSMSEPAQSLLKKPQNLQQQPPQDTQQQQPPQDLNQQQQAPPPQDLQQQSPPQNLQQQQPTPPSPPPTQNLQQQQPQSQNQQPVRTEQSEKAFFELSQVIEAANMANASLRRRDLEEQRKALARDHLIKVKGEITKIENKYRPVISRIDELESHLQAQQENLKKEAPAKILWISCQSLLNNLRFKAQNPLESDPSFNVLKQFAADNNELASSVLSALPEEALKKGVESEETLIDRFSKVERVCKRVSLVDGKDSGVGKHLLSYLQSFFVMENVDMERLDDEFNGITLVDPTKWNTFDILTRVNCCLRKHNLDLATRYANQLKGQARVVARDWIRDARIHLEVKDALNVLSTYAEAIAVKSSSNI